MPTTWFGRLVVFALVLVGLKVFFRWNISIIGSLVLTVLLYFVFQLFEKRGDTRDTE